MSARTPPTARRILIVGDSCSGKTTMGRKISRSGRIPHLDLDEIYWLENWTPKDTALFQEELRAFVSENDRWVVTGGYTGLSKDITWPLADTIIWLHYPLHKVLSRWLVRTFRRVLTRERVCGNNYETLRHSFFTKESLLLWIIFQKKKKRNKFNDWRRGYFRDKNWIEINSERDYRNFFAGFNGEFPT